MEKTLILLKPDAIEQNLEDYIKDLLEESGFEILREKRLRATKTQLEEHYSHLVDKPFFKDLYNYMTRTPLLALEVEHPNAISFWRAILGDTDPRIASKESLRGKYGKVTEADFENVAHGSDSPESAERELAIWFG